MRHWKLLMVCAIAVFAVAIPAASASAKTSVVELKSGGKAALPEAVSLIGIYLDGCFDRGLGHLTGNNLKADTFVATATELECSEEGIYTITGSITKAALSSKQTLTLTGSLSIKGPNAKAETCAYTFSKFKNLTVPLPGNVEFSGTAEGKLGKGSGKGCEKKVHRELSVTVYDLEEPVGVFEAALAS